MSGSCLPPFRLSPWFSPRVWGTRDLSPWYAIRPQEPIGEAWLTGNACQVETGPFKGRTLQELTRQSPEELLGASEEADFPLLLKLLFPHDKLSVQVHPDDALAKQMGEPRGKTECWYVLDAQPGAAVSLGLAPGTGPDAVREAIRTKTLEELLVQIPVEKGDMIFVDAGTVHAIGPGAVLLETQQTSDTTYRLYDYGRPRELHVEQALVATRLHTAAGKVKPFRRGAFERLIEERYFIVDRFSLNGPVRLDDAAGVPQALVLIQGDATLVAADARPVELRRGQAVIVPACAKSCELRGETGSEVIRSMPPATP